MKKDTWAELWKKEIDSVVPALDESVLNAPLPKSHPRIKRGVIAALAAALAIFLVVICLGKRNTEPIRTLTVEINPAATFVADKEGKVTEVVSLNMDADMLRQSEEFGASVIGQKLEEGVINYIDLAAKHGYMTKSVVESEASDDFNPFDEIRVKISVADDGTKGQEKELDSLRSGIEEYFRGRGICAVVAAEREAKENWAKKNGISGDDIRKEISLLAPMYKDRLEHITNKEEIQKIYSELVKNDGFKRLIEEEIIKNGEELLAEAKDLKEISGLNGKILRHMDNPLRDIADFWTLKKIHPDLRFEGEFGALAKEAEKKISEYENKYGVKLHNALELALRIKKYELTNIYAGKGAEGVIEALRKEGAEIFDFLMEKIDKKAADLNVMPSTKEELDEKIDEYLSFCHKSRVEAAREAYSEKRKEISKEEYEKYIERIEKEYGSLLAYVEKRGE